MAVLILIFYKKHHWEEWKIYTRPFWIYFPLTGVLFLFISFIVSSRPGLVILLDVFFATIRLCGLVSIMTLYLVESRTQDILLALRSLWYKSKIKFQWFDKLLLFFEMSIRFFPSVQEQWRNIERSQKALSINIPRSHLKKVIQISHSIPDFILLNLEKTETITQGMVMRGYGEHSPRSVYPYIQFKSIDFVWWISITITVFGVHSFVQI
jgi:energy-coupling factor transporter transmembrane protein EcfT|tara:strand:- start:620 stop:1249 length:630 start_codon:yes stop_codon:yes gene_type:complete